MSTIGENIKKFRKEKKLTQKKLAELTGLNEVTIRSYEADKYRPKYDNLKKLARVFGVQPHQLTYDDEDNFVLNNVGYPDGTVVTLSQVLYDATQNNDRIINAINKNIKENFDVRDIINKNVVLNPHNDYDKTIFMELWTFFHSYSDSAITYYLECGFYNVPVSQENINNDLKEQLIFLDTLEYDENYKEYEIQIADILFELNEKGIKKIVEFAEIISKVPEYQKNN